MVSEMIALVVDPHFRPAVEPTILKPNFELIYSE